MMHHACLLVGEPEAAESHLSRVCRNLKIKQAGNPDFFAFRSSTFGIDDARQLRDLSLRKPVTGSTSSEPSKKIFFISAESLTREAQNALLRTFEDPVSDTYFFLAAREEEAILPTLRSRMQVVRVKMLEKVATDEASKFLSLPIKDRLTFAKKFGTDLRSLPAFLDNLMLLLREKKEAEESIAKVYNVRRFAGDQSAATRLILEHLSVVL